MAPKTQYAKRSDVSIAYQVTGDGSLDLVIVPGFISHLELDWLEPRVTSHLRRLGSFSRLIRYDKRGTGLSDPVSDVPTLEERMGDLKAVMDAAESEHAALFGFSEGGPVSALFAATYPERTRGLILYGTAAKGTPDERFPWLPERRYKEIWASMQDIVDHWGDGRTLELTGPSVAHDPIRRRAVATYERASASPGLARSLLLAAAEMDVTNVLPSIRVPTLVLHRTGDLLMPVEGGRYVADQIPRARYVELPGRDHLPWLGDEDAVIEEVEEFLTGARHAREPDRVLTTVLFTDIVGSTERAAQVGDSRWRDLLARHDAIVREQLDQFSGREIDRTGDGFLARFEGPARAIRCAQATVDALSPVGVEIRAGVHTGECELIGQHLAGVAVHIGARVLAHADASEVVVSRTVKDLVVGGRFEFVEKGVHSLKGVPGDWELFALRSEGYAGAARTDGFATSVGEKEAERSLTRADRVALVVARRAPRLGRTLARFGMRSRGRP